MRKTIIDGLSGAFKATDGEAERLLRTEQDIPLRYVAMVVAGLVVLTFLFYWSTTGSLVLALAGALFLALVAFFFSAVAGYIAGVVGSSNSPVSGMTIATMLFTVLLVWVVGDLILNLATEELILATLLIAAVVASSSAIAGDVMQDLKDRKHGWGDTLAPANGRGGRRDRRCACHWPCAEPPPQRLPNFSHGVP